MDKFIRATALLAVLTGFAVPATAATQNEFYTNLLRRGVSSYEASRYADAAKQLRIAAFGFVDAIEQYQLAQMYLTLTYDKLGQPDKAREAAHRVTVAERVDRRYAASSQSVRGAFEVVAARLLTPSDLAVLRGGPIPAPPRQVTPQVPPPQQISAAPAQTTTAAKPPAPKPQPVKPPPATTTAAPQTAATQTAAAQTTAVQTTAAKPPVAKPAPATTPATPPANAGRGGPVEPARPATTPPPARTLSDGEINTRLANADRALNDGANLAEARRLYRELLAAPGLDHEALVRVAEGLYRSRDFAMALNAFTRVGALRRGEEPYRYYIAVAAYETGDYARARKELAAALPYIEITPDVARYRTRIEGAQ